MKPTLRAAGLALAGALERAGVIERSRVRAVTDLAWPRVVTGFARMSQQAADVAMVGLALGPTAVTGLAFAYTYWRVGAQLSLGLSGGAIGLVAQRFGAEDPEGAGMALKQSVLVALVLSAPLTALYWFGAPPLIGLFTSNPEAHAAGTTYLQILAVAVPFTFFNKLGSRTFAGIDDTVTPMVIRAGAATVNIVVNWVLIFGLGMGVAGAAIGTASALILAALLFAWGLLGLPYPFRGAVPVTLPLGRPHLDVPLIRELLRVAAPLMFRRLVRGGYRFPMLAILAVYGPIVVAGYEIGQRVRNLTNSLSWGFSIAASSLVGRHLGAADPAEAAATARDVLRLSLVSYVVLAGLVVVFAHAIARVFVSDPDTVAMAGTFIRVGAVAAIGLGFDSSLTGILRGGGDTTWTFYGALVGMYLVAVPLAYVSIATSLGLVALFAALLAETFVPAAIILKRYTDGVWLRRAGDAT